MAAGRMRMVRRGRRCGHSGLASLLGVVLVVAAPLPGGTGEADPLAPPKGPGEPRPLTLEESLRLATERNLRIQSARHEAAELTEEVPKAYKEFFPKLRGEARYFLQAPRPQIINPAGSTPVPPSPAFSSGLLLPQQNIEILAGQRTDYNLRLRLEQPLFAGNRLTSAYAAARLDEQIGIARLARAQHEVAGRVKVAYFEALKADAQRDAAEARARQRQAELEYVEGLVAGGRATAHQLPPVRAALAAARQEAFEASQRFQVALEDLKRLVGLEPSEAVRPAQPPEERVLVMELDEAIRMAKDQRPELHELSLETDKAREGITQARSGYYPRVGLFGIYDKQRRTVLNPRGEFVVGGIEATWSLWEWGRTNNEVAQAGLRHERAVADLRDRRAAIAQEARAAFAQVRVAERRATTLREEVEAARSAAHVAEERLREGMAVARDVIVARAELARALGRYRAAVYDAHVARAHLERVLGAGELPTVPGGPSLALEVPTHLSEVELAGVASAALPTATGGAKTEPGGMTEVNREPGRKPEMAATVETGRATTTDRLPQPPPFPPPPTGVAESEPGRMVEAKSEFSGRTEPAAPRWLEDAAVPAPRGRFNIAVAGFADRQAAVRSAGLLEDKGFGPLDISPGTGKDAGTYRVVLLGLRSPQTAERAARDARSFLRASDGPPSAAGVALAEPGGLTQAPRRAEARPKAKAGPAQETKVGARQTEVLAPAPGAAPLPPPQPPGAPAAPSAASLEAKALDLTARVSRSAPAAGSGHPVGVAQADAAGPAQNVAAPAAIVPAAAEGAAPTATGGRLGFDVAVAMFRRVDEARRLVGLLDARGFGPAKVIRSGSGYRVVLSGFSSPETAERAARDVRRMLGGRAGAALPTSP